MCKVLRSAYTRACAIIIAAAGAEAIQISVFLADLVGGVITCFGVVLLVEYLDAEITEKTLRLAAGLVLAQLLREVQNILRQADDCNAATTASLLKEIVPPRHEILHFVLPKKDRVRRFRNFASEPCALKNELE